MYLPSITPKDISVTDAVMDLFQKRVHILRELQKIDDELESIRNEQIAMGILERKAPRVEDFKPSFKPPTTKYPCHCGAVFLSYIDRDIHINKKLHDKCGRNGEIQGDHLIYRDTTIVGDPVKKSVTMRKSTALFIDDDLDIA